MKTLEPAFDVADPNSMNRQERQERQEGR